MTRSSPINGRAAVRDFIASKFPEGSLLVIERCSDGSSSGGFTWHREAVMPDGQASPIGLRGTLFAQLDDAGQISYVREGAEPIFKPGEATEKLLKAVTENAERPPKPPPTFTQETPTAASAIVRYLWEEAYPKGAEPTEALRLFSDGIRYEDFNYPEPFVGKPAVTEARRSAPLVSRATRPVLSSLAPAPLAVVTPSGLSAPTPTCPPTSS